MKFTEAWSKVAQQNVSLKVAVLSLSSISLFLGFSVVKLSLAEPFIVERTCYSQKLDLSHASPKDEEIKSFVTIALEQRLSSTKAPIEGYLSKDELVAKKEEQKLLSEKDIEQFIVIRKVELKENFIFVEADRLYSVKNVRSGFPIKLKLKLESKARTETNPYGLILVKTEEIKSETKGDS